MAGSQAAADSFRLAFLGKQALHRPTNTGFGSVQKPLRDVYMACAAAGFGDGQAGDRMSERTVQFDGHDMQIRFWEPSARRFQQEVWPIDCVTYLDLVQFHTVKGKKRQFGYFRRHTDSAEVAPDSVLIPLHKKEAKALAKRQHRPLLCFLIRRPHGIQFLECHVYQVDNEAVGVAFIGAFDRHSRAKLEEEKRSDVFNYAPWQQGSAVTKWASQPALALLAGSEQPQVTVESRSELAEPPDRQRMYQSASNVASPQHRSIGQALSSAIEPITLVPSTGGGFAVVSDSRQHSQHSLQHQQLQHQQLQHQQMQHHQLQHQQLQHQQLQHQEPQHQQLQHQQQQAALMRRTASGTIFDKYKELQAFNIPESEYMGFQEMQQQVEVSHQLKSLQQPGFHSTESRPTEPAAISRGPHLQHHQSLRDQPPPQSRAPAGVAGSSKFPSESSIPQRLQAPMAPPRTPAAPAPVQRRAPRPLATAASAQTAELNRPSTIPEELEAAERRSQLPQQPPPPSPESRVVVASLVTRFERQIGQQQQQQQQPAGPPAVSAGRPVARVPPTSRTSPPAESRQAGEAKEAKPRPQDQHRIHRQQQPSSRPQPPQEPSRAPSGASATNIVASGLGYLP